MAGEQTVGAGSDAQAAWVLRVLGVRLPARGQPGQGDAGLVADRVRRIWQAASDAADKQISALQAALRETGDEELHDIAEYGVAGVTGNYRTPMMTGITMVGLGGGAGLRKAAPKLLATIDAFQAHLDGDDGVRACDENPFGVKVTLRASLREALVEIAAELRRAVGT